MRRLETKSASETEKEDQGDCFSEEVVKESKEVKNGIRSGTDTGINTRVDGILEMLYWNIILEQWKTGRLEDN